jgi:uncharacterized protein YodC (DUF2158 family)
MTVLKYEPADGEEVICQWFSTQQLSEKAFHQDVLRFYPNRPSVTKSYQLP